MPSGPYPVGTQEFSWTDPTRPELHTKNPDDRRRVVIQVWYPAETSTEAERALYLQRPEEFASQAGGSDNVTVVVVRQRPGQNVTP